MQKVIIIEGHDRSGKTTVADLVAKHFNTEVFMTNSRECFADLKSDSSNLAKFNYFLALYISKLNDSQSINKPIIIYRSFLSEMVYSDLFNRQTDTFYNVMTDAIFHELEAKVFLLKNTKTDKYNDDMTSDEDIKKSIELFDYYRDAIQCDIIEIETHGHDAIEYASKIINHINTKEGCKL